MILDGELERGMPPDNNQAAKRSVHGNRIPPIGLLAAHYLIAGTPDMGTRSVALQIWQVFGYLLDHLNKILHRHHFHLVVHQMLVIAIPEGSIWN
jgi:hypothetical protein